MINSGIWLGMNGWSSVYNFNDSPSEAKGQILNAPSTNGWTEGWRATAPWYAFKANDSRFNFRQ